MTARNQDNEQADDVATLYSWANLHGAKYRDFSASRQEARAQMRQRTMAERASLAREEALRERPIEEQARWEDVLSAGRSAASLSARAEAAAANRQESAAERRYDSLPPLLQERVHGSLLEALPETTKNVALPTPEELIAPNGHMEEIEAGQLVGPAWLTEKPERTVAMPLPATETLQQSRERVASRWFALRGILGRGQDETQPERVEGRAPVLTVFSLAGGVGKTSLVASVGRALAARGERVLLADTCSFGLLPFYFGAHEIKPGALRTFSGGSGDPPIRVMTLDAERENPDNDLLRREVVRVAQNASRVLIDVATGSAGMLRQALRISPAVLVPVVPDMASVVTLQSLEAFFRGQESVIGQPIQASYVLNQFDPSLPLHLDVREVLRQQLAEKLLPFAIHRSTAVSEALAEGMTVIDYAPNSSVAEDMMNVVAWIRNTSVAATAGHRGVRWSER